MRMTPTLSGFAAGGAGWIGTAHFVNRSLCGATLSSFLSKFESQGFGFFDAAVQLFKQGRHLKWDIRSHRASARYWMAMSGRCSKQDMVSTPYRRPRLANGRSRQTLEGDGIEKWLQATEFDRPLPDDRAAILAARAKSAVMFTVTADEAAWRTGHKTESIYRRYAITSEADLRERVERLNNTTEPRNEG